MSFLKNVAGQEVGAQLLDIDGSGNENSDPVLVYVTLEDGNQALGATGGGSATHKGKGYYVYTPTAGETNANHVAYTFVATGAVPVTIQMYPVAAAQSGDAYALLASLLGTDGVIEANVVAYKGLSNVVDKMIRLAKGIVDIVVGSGSTVNLIILATATPDLVADDQWRGKVLTFEDDTLTEALRGQSTPVTSCSATGDSLTVIPLTHAPVAGDEATIS